MLYKIKSKRVLPHKSRMENKINNKILKVRNRMNNKSKGKNKR